MEEATIEISFPMTKTRLRLRKSSYVAVERRVWERVQGQLNQLQHALKVIRQGEQEYRQGKTRVVKSLTELL